MALGDPAFPYVADELRLAWVAGWALIPLR
jgi:hypothetical protein